MDGWTDRQRDRERKTQREREIKRQTDRQADRQAGREAGRHADRQTGRQEERQTGRHIYLITFGHTHTNTADMVIYLKVLVKSFNCEDRSCYIGNPCESFFEFAKVSRKLDLIL